MVKPKQLSLSDVYSHCSDCSLNDKPEFLRLLEENIDLSELVPISFRNHFYLRCGRPRDYPLDAFLWAFLLQVSQLPIKDATESQSFLQALRTPLPADVRHCTSEFILLN